MPLQRFLVRGVSVLASSLAEATRIVETTSYAPERAPDTIREACPPTVRSYQIEGNRV